MGKLQVQKVSWWHERLADWMIACPDQNIADAAKYFDCHPNTLSIIKNSDSFKQYWSTRSAEASSAVVTDVKDKMLAITEVALDNISNRLKMQGSVMPIDTLVGITAMGMKSMGYGVSKSPTVVINNNGVDPALLALARERIQNKFGVETAQANAEVLIATPVPQEPSRLLETQAPDLPPPEKLRDRPPTISALLAD